MFFYQLPCFLICASKTLNYYQKSQMDYLLILLTIIFCLNSNSKQIDLNKRIIHLLCLTILIIRLAL